MSLVGADGEVIFSSLLLDCGLFVRLKDGQNNYYQLSGIPLHDLCLKKDGRNSSAAERVGEPPPSAKTLPTARKLSEILLVRNRILYSKPSLNRNKSIQFGLKHMHILNRLTDLQDQGQDITVLRYVFPRQFKMHNVFTSLTDRRETVQAFKDYTFREDELHSLSTKEKRALPRRLRGPALQLIRKLRRAHRRCSYSQVLAHHCPVPVAQGLDIAQKQIASRPYVYNSIAPTSSLRTQIKPPQDSLPPTDKVPSAEENTASFLPYATPAEHVSGFCRAILTKLLPKDTFGSGSDGANNWHKIMNHLDAFVRMRKFETVNLHELVQGLRVKSVPWLASKGANSTSKLAVSDTKKRQELLHELVYYVFDSLIIPLINSNFYVTESGIHRNKLLYFRHDVWGRLCQPCLASAKLGALVPVSAGRVRGLQPERLGFSPIRLLPKETGTRSITNLKRRSLKVVNGKRLLAPSINAKLTPIFNIFNYERGRDTGVFKSDSLSVQNLHSKLSLFKSHVPAVDKQRLYLVKTDIRSAFDSIPHAKLLALVYKLFSHKQYSTVKHAECRWVRGLVENSTSRSAVRFVKSAVPARAALKPGVFESPIATTKKHIIYSDIGQQQTISREQAKKLLEEHVQANIVKVGKKYYRHLVGIPQGSILSSLLCTFFYNDFEANRLSFLNPRSSLLLRIIDDFLLITTEQAEAIQFIKAMKAGDAEYGIFVHPEKSLVNFDMTIDGVQIPKLSHTRSFPFCGLSIDSENLQVSKDRVRKDNVVANTLTVDVHGHVGEKFKRRVMSSLRIQLQNILLDTSLNGQRRVMRTLVECFQETAMKMHQYYMSLPRGRQPSSDLLIALIEQLINLATRTMRQRRTRGEQGFTHPQICSLAAAGIARVLATRKTKYSTTLTWLQELRMSTQHSLNLELRMLDQIVEGGFESLQHYIY